MSYIDDLNTAAAEALAASSSATDSAQIMADVANGDENTTVTTANGEVKTLAKAIKDIIDTIEAGVEAPQVEPQTLSAGQTTVTLSTMTTEGIAVYVEGSREFDFTIVNSTDFDFSQSFPDGTRIWVVKRDIEGVADSFTVNTSTGSQTLSNALDQRVIYVDTLADLQALPTGGLVDGQGGSITTGTHQGGVYWDSTDLSTATGTGEIIPGHVNGALIVPDGDTTGASGAWRRPVQDYLGASIDWWGSNYQAALDYCAANGLNALVGPGTRVMPSEGLDVGSVRIMNFGDVIWDATGLDSSTDCFRIYASNLDVNGPGILGKYKLDMGGNGRDGIWIQKCEHCNIGTPLIDSPGRHGFNFEPNEDFAWIENVVSHSAKVSNAGGSFIKVTINDFTNVFANKITFYDFEGRRCAGYPIHVVLNGTTTAQKAGEWAFHNAEIDGNTSVEDYAVFAERTNSPTSGECNSWAFHGGTIEALGGSEPTRIAAVHSVDNTGGPGGPAVDDIFKGLFFNTYVGDGRYPRPISSGADATRRALFTAIKINTVDDYSHEVIGGTRFDRIVLTGDSISKPGSSLQLDGKLDATGVSELTSSFSGGDSFFSAGQTKVLETIGGTIANGGYELHEVCVIPADGTLSPYSEWRIYANGSSANVKEVLPGDFSLAVNGSDVEITNDSAGGRTVRVHRLKKK